MCVMLQREKTCRKVVLGTDGKSEELSTTQAFIAEHKLKESL